MGAKNTAWHYLEDQNDYGEGLGTWQWVANTDDPLSMAIAPVVTYDGTATAIARPSADTVTSAAVTGMYTIGGQRVEAPVKGHIYIVKRADGTTRKMLWK